MNILVVSIMRNREIHIDTFWKQLNAAISLIGDQANWYISIYENDSTDRTKEMLHQLDMSQFLDYSVITEDVGTRYYGSTMEEDRVRNLANARNKALVAKDLYLNADYILNIEPDILYNPKLIYDLVNFQQFGLKSIDVFSGLLNRSDGTGNVYDTWCTRRNNFEEVGEKFIDWEINPVKEFWATANGVCLYNAEPFQKGIRYGYINPRWKRSDCDTAVICEDFRLAGYNKIYVHQKLISHHNP